MEKGTVDEKKGVVASPPGSIPKDWPSYTKVREPWEDQTDEILKLPEVPGIVRRYLNPDARYGKNGRDGGWQMDDQKHMQSLGDLRSGWMPKDVRDKRNAFYRHKHERLMQAEIETRKIISEQIARDSKTKHVQWTGFSFNK